MYSKTCEYCISGKIIFPVLTLKDTESPSGLPFEGLFLWTQVFFDWQKRNIFPDFPSGQNQPFKRPTSHVSQDENRLFTQQCNLHCNALLNVFHKSCSWFQSHFRYLGLLLRDFNINCTVDDICCAQRKAQTSGSATLYGADMASNIL